MQSDLPMVLAEILRLWPRPPRASVTAMTNAAAPTIDRPHWPAVTRWRKAERERLLAARRALPRAERQRRSRLVYST